MKSRKILMLYGTFEEFFFSGVEVSSIFTPHAFKMLKQIRDRPLTTLTREHDSNLILRSL